jgi:nucleoside 2-deoxyribosyltransferase
MGREFAPYLKLYYLASPYTHDDPKIRKQRAEEATVAAVTLLKHDIFVFAPIPYNEPWEKYNVPGHWDFWADFDKAFVSRMDGIIVLQIDGWDKSRGVKFEIEYAQEHDIPVFYLTPEQVKNNDFEHITKSRIVTIIRHEVEK